jgi:CRISPR-associated exonuclease Cas4
VIVFVAVFIFVLGLLLLWISARQRGQSGLPAGRIIYTDTKQWGPVEKPLYDGSLNLTGKPDYLVEQGQILIPVEVKSRRTGQAPYDGQIFQLAAYCLLVERVFGKRPPYGILHFPNRTFAIDYTPELEAALLDLLAEIRADESRKEVNRSHDSAARCLRCGYRSVCNQTLK